MILITGGTGTVGSELVRILVERGGSVRALVRDPERAESIRRPGVEFVRGDLSRRETLPAALDGCDHVFLLTPTDSGHAECQGNLIDVAKADGAQPHIVKLSVLGADLNAANPVLRQHARTELHLEDTGLPWTMLRPGPFMQNFLRASTSIASRGEFVHPAGSGKVAWVDARDVAEAAVRVLLESGHQYKTYELTGPRALLWSEVADILAVASSREAVQDGLLATVLPDWYREMPEGTLESPMNPLLSLVTPTLRSLLRRPPSSFETFARDHAGAFGFDQGNTPSSR
jgi:uncharacterized protein YbjT (DUF2867 family)